MVPCSSLFLCSWQQYTSLQFPCHPRIWLLRLGFISILACYSYRSPREWVVKPIPAQLPNTDLKCIWEVLFSPLGGANLFPGSHHQISIRPSLHFAPCYAGPCHYYQPWISWEFNFVSWKILRPSSHADTWIHRHMRMTHPAKSQLFLLYFDNATEQLPANGVLYYTGFI